MQMSRKINLAIPYFCDIHRLVCKYPRTKFFCLSNLDTFSIVLLFTHNVMISTHQLEIAGGEMLDDLTYNFPFLIVVAMKQVAQEYHASRLDLIDHVNENFRILLISGWRYWQAGLPKVIDLAEMKVSHHQRVVRGKKKCLFGKQDNWAGSRVSVEHSNSAKQGQYRRFYNRFDDLSKRVPTPN